MTIRSIAASSAEAERPQARTLADVAQERVDGADRRAGGRSPRISAADATPSGDADEARARGRESRLGSVEARGPPGSTAARAVPWATRPRVPIAWPRAWTRPTPVPLACPTPARCEAMSICERASRSVPSATARRSHGPTVRMTPRAIASANGFGLRGQQRLQRVGHRIDARSRRSPPAAGRRSAPGRGWSPPAAGSGGRCSPCARRPRR